MPIFNVKKFSKTLSFLLLSLNGINWILVFVILIVYLYLGTYSSIIRPAPNSVYNCHNPKGIKFITRLQLGLSHLREHKFKHNFQDLINLLCNCGHNTEPTTHFLLPYLLIKEAFSSVL